MESHHFSQMRKMVVIVLCLMLHATMASFAEQQNPLKLSVSRIMEMKAPELKQCIEQELHAGADKWKGMAESMTALQQYAIAELYLTGEVTGDVVQDRREAMFWLLKSAHKGLAAAQFRLGTWCQAPSSIFKLGDMITQTPEEAFFWFKKAAEAGYPPAFRALGDAYKDGEGCAKNLELAKFWLTRAVIEHRSAYALESLLPLIDSEDELVRILTEAEKINAGNLKIKFLSLLISMYCLRKRRKGEVCILFDFEGKNDLFHQLSHARNGKDHAFFMLGALLDKYNPLGKTYRVCDFINVIYSEHNKVCCSIVSSDNGFSSVELSLPENLFSLLLHIIEKTDSRISVNELLFSDCKENKIAVRLFYREDSFIIS